MHKMSQNLEVGDAISLGGLIFIIDERNAYSSAAIDMELILHLWVSPKEKIIIGLPNDIPIRVKKI